MRSLIVLALALCSCRAQVPLAPAPATRGAGHAEVQSRTRVIPSEWRCDSCGYRGPQGDIPVEIIPFRCPGCGVALEGFWEEPGVDHWITREAGE